MARSIVSCRPETRTGYGESPRSRSPAHRAPSRVRKNPTFDVGARGEFGYDARNPFQGGAHAWGRPTARSDVQLHLAGSPRAAGPSPPGDPRSDGRGAAGAVAALRGAVCARRPAVDPAGAVAAGPAAASALHGAQRAAADGAARLQPALSLVRGVEHG